MDIRRGLEFSRTFYRAIGPNRAIMRRMRSKMRKMRSKMRKMRSKMRKMRRKMRKMRSKCEKCEAKCEKCEAKCKDIYPKGTLIYASKTSIVATLFRSKIICTVRIRIGSFFLSNNKKSPFKKHSFILSPYVRVRTTSRTYAYEHYVTPLRTYA